VINLNVLVREWTDEIVFLHRIVPGGTDKSYGIHVARLAGVPRGVIHRARELLERLETSSTDGGPSSHANLQSIKGPEVKFTRSQMMLFSEPPNKLAELLKNFDTDSMSPMEALAALKELQERAKQN
jgi:DNA mismatch repair protein MutS